MKREMKRYPPYQIKRNGEVYLDGKRVHPEVRQGVYQSRLTVRIGDSWLPVETLLSEVWYDNALIVPRNGCVLDFSEKNSIALRKIPKLYEITADKVLWTWTCYEKNGEPVHRLGEVTGLHHWTTADFTKLITEILIAGIRL